MKVQCFQAIGFKYQPAPYNADRGRYAALKNDHVGITGRLERALADYHAASAASTSVREQMQTVSIEQQRGAGNGAPANADGPAEPKRPRLEAEEPDTPAVAPDMSMEEAREEEAGSVATVVSVPLGDAANSIPNNIPLAPFAVVDEVTGGSPAHEDGMMAGRRQARPWLESTPRFSTKSDPP